MEWKGLTKKNIHAGFRFEYLRLPSVCSRFPGVLTKVVSEAPTDGQHDEEAMLTYVRSFADGPALREYISSHLHLPSSMHPRFTTFRQKLGASMKEFKDLEDMRRQLAYFFDLLTELQVIPSNWLIFGACAAYLHQKSGGRLVENTASIFSAQETLAQFCGMRARYVVLGLKDMCTMRVLKCSNEMSKSIAEMASELDSPSAPTCLQSFSLNGPSASETVPFLSALTAFDADAVMQRGGGNGHLPSVIITLRCEL